MAQQCGVPFWIVAQVHPVYRVHMYIFSQGPALGRMVLGGSGDVACHRGSCNNGWGGEVTLGVATGLPLHCLHNLQPGWD